MTAELNDGAEDSMLTMDKKTKSSPLYESRPILKRINNNEEDPYSIALFITALISHNTTCTHGKAGDETKGHGGNDTEHRSNLQRR
jgi:hypothetical protein